MSGRRGLTRGDWFFTALMLALAAVCLWLGTWQMQRLGEKEALIAAVDLRQAAAPIPVPPKEQWAGLDSEALVYQPVELTGAYRYTQTVTVFTSLADPKGQYSGPGYWVVTPFALAGGGTVFVNRGFVPADRSGADARLGSELAAGPVTVTGLLRISEPGGGFLRANDPAADRWFSRDVAAIAAAKGLENVAPYFIDADATPNPGGLPVGGLTVVTFRNSHLVYALTWYALAVMSAFAAYSVHRRRFV